MFLETSLEEGERRLAHIWKTTAMRGAVAIAFAVLILVWPNIGLATLIALFGAFAFVSGLATVVGAFRLPLPRGDRVWLVVEGALGIAVGVAVVIWPDLSARGLLFAIGAWAIAAGMFEIALTAMLPISGSRKLLAGLGGILSIVFGVVMFSHPGAGAVALLALVAAFALVTGVMQIAFALELRKVAADLEERISPRATTKTVVHA
jgi:uncharacterized membrane protein HdeD (DUF308 family)